jgi:hypothetical protein
MRHLLLGLPGAQSLSYQLAELVKRLLTNRLGQRVPVLIGC